jgi:hypothetical protein
MFVDILQFKNHAPKPLLARHQNHRQLQSHSPALTCIGGVLSCAGEHLVYYTFLPDADAA